MERAEVQGSAEGFHPLRAPARRKGLLVLLLLLALALTVRTVYWRQYTSLPVGRVAVGADAREYDAWAREILMRGPLWDHVRIHAPLYPLFLAGLYRLSGVRIPVARGLQLLLDMGSLLLVSAALWRLVGRRCALFCVGLWALYQPLIYYSAELFSEGLAVFFLSGMLFCWAMAQGPGGRGVLRPWLLGVGSFLGGLAAITHPLTLFLTVPTLVWFGWFTRHLPPPRHRLLLLALPLWFALPILPVALRNHAVSGTWTPIQANEGVNLFIGNNPEATGTCYLRPGREYDRIVALPLADGAGNDADARKFFRQRVLHFYRTQPWQALTLLVRKALLTWNDADITSGPDLPEMQVATPFMRLPLLRFGMLAPLALIGWLWWRRPRLLPFLWMPLWGTLALTVFVTSGRYRVPMTPALLASAALGLEAIARCWRRGDQRAAMLAAVLACVGLGVSHAVPVPPIPSSRSETILLLAEAAWRVGDYEEASRLLSRGLERDPRDPAMHHLMGNVLAARGRWSRAVGAFQEAINLDPSRTEARVDMAIALSEMGLRADAEEALETALRHDPDNPAVWYNLGVVREHAGNVSAAEAAYRKTCALDPVHPSARLNLAVLLHKTGHPDEALPYYRQVLRVRPRDDKALAGLAVYYAQKGDVDKAAHFFEKALRANPGRDDLRRAYRLLREQQATPGDQSSLRRHQAGNTGVTKLSGSSFPASVAAGVGPAEEAA